MKELIEKLRKDADEIEACGGKSQALTMREAADKLEASLTDKSVWEFASDMREKLRRKQREGRSGWPFMCAGELSTLLHELVAKGDPLDVAAVCMMLYSNQQAIAPKTGEKRFIVWNDDRTEGFVTDDEEDANQAANGRFRWTASALGERFFELYDDHNRTIEEIFVDKPVDPA